MVRLAALVALLLPGCEEAPPVGCHDDFICPGSSHTYVIDRLRLPVSGDLVDQYGVDIDGDPQGWPENAVGRVLSELTAASADLKLQAWTDELIDTGGLILLERIRATAITTATGVGAWTYVGEELDPSPCTDALDTVCRRHLDGDGSFRLSDASALDSRVVGFIAGGTYAGGPGTIDLPLFAGDQQFRLRLYGARMEVQVSESALGSADAPGRVGGGIRPDDLDSDLLPWALARITGAIAADCTSSVPPCGCAAGSAGQAVIGLFDEVEPRDCAVTLDELRNNSLIAPLLVADVDLFDADGNFNPRSDGVDDSLSFGLAFTAVGATYDYLLDPDEPGY